MIFVEYVRYYHKEQKFENMETAINRAIDRCIEEGVLAEFLRKNRNEVVKVTQLDYTFDRQITLEREDARAEGRAEGREEGQKKIILKLYQKGYSIEQIAEMTDTDMHDIEEMVE